LSGNGFEVDHDADFVGFDGEGYHIANQAVAGDRVG